MLYILINVKTNITYLFMPVMLRTKSYNLITSIKIKYCDGPLGIICLYSLQTTCLVKKGAYLKKIILVSIVTIQQ